ncbi:MAG: hypothetical protein FJ128_11360 [Deltaproteobacteria bacterium]|nr:hypothetical protein [Deltaproteobacteria bacterium]
MIDMVTFKQKEAKTLTLTVKENGNPVSLVGAVLFLGVKRTKGDAEYVFSKGDADFNKGQAAQGIVSVLLSTGDLTQEPGPYVGELKVSYPDGTIDKSADLTLVIKQAVTG